MLRPYTLSLVVPLTLVVLLLTSSCSSGLSSLTAPTDSERSLTLLLYGDSMLTFPPNEAAIDAYTEMLEEDLGVPVDVQFPGMGPCCSPPVIADYLTSDRAESELETADIVIIESPLSGLAYSVATAAGLLEGLDPADCGGDDNQQCLRDSLAEYKDGVAEVFSLLTEAVDPSETLIRAADGYALMVEDQFTADTLQMTNPYWQEAQEFFTQTTAQPGRATPTTSSLPAGYERCRLLSCGEHLHCV